jgi:hypothetical protein
MLVWTTPAFATFACGLHYINGDPNNYFYVCIEKRDNGYDAAVQHPAGPTYLVDFNLVNSTGVPVGDAGNSSLSPGTTWHTYFFATGYFTWAQVVLYWRSGSPEFSGRWSACWSTGPYASSGIGNC